MANEPKLRKKNIEELEDRVTILEGGTPRPHHNTMTKPELEDLDDRITVLEGNEPETHNNEMRLSDISDFEERVEVLEEDEPIKEYEVDFVKIFNDTYKDDPVQFITNAKLEEVGAQAFLESIEPTFYVMTYVYVAESLDTSKAHSFIIEAEDGNHLTGDKGTWSDDTSMDSAIITLRTKKDGTFLVVVTMNGETGEYEASVTPAN